MARHGHYRHSRIDRLIKARKQWEASEGEIEDVDVLLEVAKPIQSPLLKPSDIHPDDACDPLQNETCPDDVPDTTEASLSKRQVEESPQSTLAEPIVPVVGQNSNSHTVWQSTTDAFPITVQSPASSATTSTAESTTSSATATISLPTVPIVIPTPPSTSSTQTPTSKPTQTAAISSPSALSSSSSIPFTSTPLITPTTSAPSLAITNPSFAVTVTTTTSLTSSSSTSDYSDTTSTSTTTTYVGPDKIGGTATGTGSGVAPSTGESQPTSDSGSGSGSGPPNKAATPKIVGGVIGSVAGLAMIFLLLFYLLRRRRFFQRTGVQALPSDDAGAREMAESGPSNDPLFTAAAFVKRWRKSAVSTNTDSTVSSSNPSERGFQKISGRKIPPVLTHGGDGYGGGLPGDSPTIPGFFPASPGRGPYSPSISHRPPPTSPYGMPLDTNYTREADEFTTPTRPRAAHLPVSCSVSFGSPTTVNPSHPMAQPQSAVPMSSPPRPGGLDRSSPSFDGSRGSRFTESLDL